MKPNNKIKQFFDDAEYFWRRFQKLILTVVGGFSIIFGAGYVAIDQYQSYRNKVVDSPIQQLEEADWEYDVVGVGDTVWYLNGVEYGYDYDFDSFPIEE